MASNALEYKIRFVEESDSLNNLVKRVTERLNGAEIKLRLGGLDISNISSQLTQLQGSIKEVQDLFGKTGDAASFKGMADGLKTATESMKGLKDTLTELNNTLSSSLGANIGNAIVQGLAQANDAIGTTMANLQKMNELASNKDLPKDLNQKVNLDLAMTKLAEVEKYMTAIGKRQEASSHLGFDTGKIDEYQGRLNLVKASLEEIKKKEGEGTRVDTILRNAHYGELTKGLTNELKAVDEVSVAIDKVKASIESLKNIRGFDKLKNDLKDTLDALQRPGATKMVQSEQVNRHLTSLFDQTKEAVKANSQATRDQQKEEDKLAQEVARAQKAIQKEIDITRQKYDELYAARLKLMEKSLFSGVDNSRTINDAWNKLSSMISLMRQMETMQKATPKDLIAFSQSDQLKAWKKDFDDLMKSVREQTKGIADSLKIDNLLSGLTSRIQALRDSALNASNLGLTDVADKANQAADSLNKVKTELEAIKSSGKSSQHLTFGEYMRTGEYSSRVSQADKDRREVERRIRQDQQDAARRNRADAANEIKRLKDAMKQINAIQAKSPELKINGIERAIEDIKRLIRLLEQAKASGSDIGRIKGIMGDYSAQNMSGVISRLGQDQQAAAQAAAQHEQAQQRMSQAIAQATGEARQQSQVLGDLRSMAAQYLSVWGASNFVKEVAQITGELELQQKSLEVIIGSAGKAQELFNDIKGMSQMSPYTFQDLLKTTRQLAAFGIETKDLYSTMKQLSDIGAGLDVDVQRLVLAYGHIKSAGVLTGIQRRQLETAGIGITSELAKLYNERYRRSGSDERVSVEDVFKRITKREVGFEDVEEVFNRLTSPGGKFYEMQLKQYDTLGGKLRNLRNNYNIMLDEIGKAHHSLLTGGVDTLNSLMENWRKWGEIIKSVGAGIIAVKVAQATMSKSILAHRAATLASARMLRETRASNYITGATTAAPQTMGLPYVNAINNSNLTRFQKIRVALYSNVAKDARYILLTQQGLTPVYANHVNQMTKMQLRMERLKWSSSAFATNMGMAMKSIVANPYTWIFAAIAAITALISRYKELNRQEEQTRKSIREGERQDITSIDSALSPAREAFGYRVIRGQVDFRRDIGTEEARELVYQLDQELQKFDPLYKGHLLDINSMEDEVERAKAMIIELEETKGAKEEAERLAGPFASAIRKTATGLPGTDPINENIKDQADYIEEKTNDVKANYEELEKKARELYEMEKKVEQESGGEYAPMPRLTKFIEEYDRLKEELGDAYSFEDAVSASISRGKNPFYIDPTLQGKTEGFAKDFMGLLNKFADVPEFLDFTKMGARKNGIPWFDESGFESSRKTIEKDMDRLKKVYQDGMKNIYKTRSDFEGKTRAKFLNEMTDKLLNTEGYEVTDPATKQRMVEMLYEYYSKNLQSDEEGLSDFMTNVMPQLIKQQADQQTQLFMEGIRSSGEFDLDHLSEADISALRKHLMAKVATDWDMTGDLAPILKQKFEEAFNIAIKGANPAEVNLEPWQKKIKDALKLEKFDDVKVVMGIDVGVEADLQEFIKKTQKKYGELMKAAKDTARDLNIRTNLGLKIDVNAAFGSVAGIKKLRDQIWNSLSMGMPGILGRAIANHNEQYKAMKPLLDMLDQMIAIAEAGKATKYDMAGTNPGGPNDPNKGKKEKTGSKDNAADKADREEMQRIRDKIRLIQDLNRAYKTYRELGYGELEALKKVRLDYESQFEEGKRPFNFDEIFKDVASIENFTNVLRDISNKEIKGNKKLKEKSEQELNREALKAITDVQNTRLREVSNKVLSELNSELELLSERFSVLRKIVESTGDELDAANVAGIGETGREKYSDLVRNQLLTVIEELAKASDLNISELGELDFDKIAKMDKDGIENYVKEVFGKEATVDWVPAITEWAKAYRKAIRDENKAAAEAYAKAMGAAMDYESQKRRIETALEDEKRKINESNASPENKQKAIGVEEANAAIKLLELEDRYKRFFDGVFSESKTALKDMSNVIKNVYQTALEKGAITADAYAKKIAEVNNVMLEFEKQDRTKWWEKGIFDDRSIDERIKEMRNKGIALEQEGAEMEQRGIATANGALIQQGRDKKKEGQQMQEDADEEEKRQTRFKRLNSTVSKIISTFDALNKAIDFVSNALDAFGVNIDTLQDISSVIGGGVEGAQAGASFGGAISALAPALGNAGPWGAAAGAALGIAGQLAQIHDKNLQRRIDEIKLDTTKMSNTLESIKSLRERQFGYDTGELRRMLGSLYAGGSNTNIDIARRNMNRASLAMGEYYARYSGGSGYEQELNLLEEQRKKIMEMYNLEDSKKKKSKEDLEDYKKQIADLDEQIHFFVVDLAKELWSIDLKSWADQFGDALMTAFENGTSAAAAFKDTVQDIMRGVVKSMLVTGVIEPAMQKLSDKLFGKDGNGGLLNLNDPKGSIGAVLAELGNWFNTEGPALMDAANEFYNGADNMMRQTLGYGMRENERSENTVNSIQSAASEETMGVVAGYLSRISQDVSVQRIMQEMFVNGSWPSYIEQVTSANNSLTAIDRSTTAMMEMMRDGNGALYERVENMSRRLDNFANGIDRIYIN